MTEKTAPCDKVMAGNFDLLWWYMTTKEEIQTEINDVLGDLPSNIEKLIRERNTAQKLINKLDEENTALKEERDTLKAKLDKLREALS